MDGLNHMKHHGGLALFWLVALFLAIYLLLTFFNPDYVQRKDHKDRANGQNDQAVTMLYALVILAVILLILWALWYAFSCAW